MRRSFRLAVLVSLLAVLACRRPPPDPGTLRVALESAPQHLDPRIGTDQASERVHDLAFRGLVRRTAIGTPEPDLAARWSWRDEWTLAMELVPEVRFVDGRALTATDVVWTYRSLLDPALGSAKRGAFAVLDPTQPVEAEGERTVVFRCREACPGLLLSLNLGIVPAGVSPAATLTQPIGAGPMRIVEVVADERLRLEPTPAGGTMPLELLVMPDATSRALALEGGAIDLAINNVPPDLIERFRRDPRFVVVDRAGSNFAYLGFQCRHAALQDPRVRQAIAHAIDRRALLHGLQRGLGDLTESILPAGHADRADDLEPLAYDPDRARQLLAAAGYGPNRPLRLTYQTSTDEQAVQQATAIQAMLHAVDVTIDVRPYDFSILYDNVKRGVVPIYSLVWTSVADPDLMRMVFHSQLAPPAGWNRGRYANLELDDLLDRAARLPPSAERSELYRRAQHIVRDDMPYVPLWHRRNVVVARRGLEGIEIGPLGEFRFLADVRRNVNAPRSAGPTYP